MIHTDRHDTDIRTPRRGLRLSPAQAVALGLVAASVGWAAWLVRDRPINEEVELLPGTVLPSSEMAIVEAAFDRAQLADHRTEDGRVWVPRPRQSAYMRALVDAEALPREFGSSLRRALENNSPWQSRAVQEEMLRVAVQEELAHVICSMPGIERAAVLYDVGQRSGLDGGLGGGPIRTASVNIRTQPDVELEPARIQAIRVLVAASIAGLEADHVAVTDLRSGRVHAGPLTDPSPSGDVAVDPELARRVAHERHLAAKVRQALTFVKGAIVDVTVAFSQEDGEQHRVEDVPEPPQAPPALSPLDQRAADANAPASVEPRMQPRLAAPVTAEAAPAGSLRAASARVESPPRMRNPPRADGPARIVVSVALPDAYLRAVVHAAVARDPQADPATEEHREQERLAALVRNLLPSLPDADACRIVMTTFPTVATQGGRGSIAAGVPAAASAGRAPEPATGSTGGLPVGQSAGQRPRTPGELVDATWQAVARGEVAAVPREAWVVLITLSAAALAGLVLRGAADAGRSVRSRRGGQPRIDWGSIEVDAGESPATMAARQGETGARKVAA